MGQRETVTATASVNGAATVPDRITWASGNTHIFRVRPGSGLSATIQALHPGNATLSATMTFTLDGVTLTRTATATVSVYEAYVPDNEPSGPSGPSESSEPSEPSRPNSGVDTENHPDPSVPGGTETQNPSVTETTARPSVSTEGDTTKADVSTSMGDEMVRQAEENHSETVVVSPDIQRETRKTEVTLPGRTVGQIGERTGADLRVETPAADVTIPNGALADLGGTGDLTVSTERTDRGVDVEIKMGDERVDTVPGGMKVKIPQDGLTNSTVAAVVHPDGTREIIRTSLADLEDGSLFATVDGSVSLEILDNHKDFSDVSPRAWYADEIDFASSHELMNGAAPGIFNPEGITTRATIAMLLYNLENNPEAGAPEFPDTAEGAWYTDAVTWATDHGVVKGYDDGRFGPDDTITREQMAMILYNYAQFKGIDLSGQDSLSSFQDYGSVSGWAVPALRWAVSEGLIKGTGEGTLNPAGSASRSQVAPLLMRFCRLLAS